MLSIKVKRIHPYSTLPSKATVGSACYDVYACDKVMIEPWEKVLVCTGLAFELPRGYGMDIRPRSGLASRGLMVMNSPGTLDSDYRGELKVAMINFTSGRIRIHRGARIAQIRFFKTLDIGFEEVWELSETDRGEGGFGSTGE